MGQSSLPYSRFTNKRGKGDKNRKSHFGDEITPVSERKVGHKSIVQIFNRLMNYIFTLQFLNIEGLDVKGFENFGF